MKIIDALKSYWQNSKAIRRLYRNPLKRTENVSVKDKIEREFYDNEARKYLDPYDPERFRYDAHEDMPARHRHFYSLLDDIAGRRVLDICCGHGITSVRCAKKGAHVTSIDLSPVMIELARKNAAGNDVSNRIDLFLMSAHDIGFADSTFDYVVGAGALHHLNPDLAGGEIARVLKPGGTGIFLEPLIPFKWLIYLRSLFPHRCMESPGGGGMVRWDIETFGRNFLSYELTPYLFFAKFGRLPILDRHIDRLERIDRRLADSFPPLYRLYWAAVLEFRQ